MNTHVFHLLARIPLIQERLFLLEKLTDIISPENVGEILKEENAPTTQSIPDAITSSPLQSLYHLPPSFFEFPPLKAVRLHDVRVRTKAGITSIGSSWLLWLSHGASAEGSRKKYGSRFSPRWLRPLRRIPGPALCLTHPCPHIYYHALVDLSMQITALRHVGLAVPTIVICGAYPSWLRELVTTLVEPDKIIAVEGEANLVFDELWMMSPPAVRVRGEGPWLYRRDLLEEHIAALRSAWSLPTSPSPHRRLFVTRNGRRGLENNTELSNVFLQHGFSVVDPGTMSVREQVALFSQAVAIAGVHGSGLANILFAPASCRILEIFSSDWLSPCYHYLAALRGQQYDHCIGSPFRRGKFYLNATSLEDWLRGIRQ